MATYLIPSEFDKMLRRTVPTYEVTEVVLTDTDERGLTDMWKPSTLEEVIWAIENVPGEMTLKDERLYGALGELPTPAGIKRRFRFNDSRAAMAFKLRWG